MKSKLMEIEEQNYIITIYQSTTIRKGSPCLNIFTFTIHDEDNNLIEEDDDVKTSYLSLNSCKKEAIDRVNEISSANSFSM
jgi:NADPH-dependent 7-cyano-7-deazaguanine reductase QueF-like protein